MDENLVFKTSIFTPILLMGDVLQIISTEGHLHPLPQFYIWTIICDHQATFYPFRQALVPWLGKSVLRVLPTAVPAENRKLSVRVSSIIFQWELRAQSTASTDLVARMPAHQMEITSSFVMQMACYAAGEADSVAAGSPQAAVLTPNV